MAKQKTKPENPVKGDRGTWILDAAAKLFAHSTFEKTATAEIARKAGVAEGTIYRYFKTKEDLLFAVVTRMVQSAYDDAVVIVIVEKSLSAEQKLCAFVLNHFVQISEHTDAARLFLFEVRGTQTYKTSSLRKLNSDYSNLLTVILKQGQTDKLFDPDLDPYIFRDIVFGGMDHAAQNFLIDNKQTSIAELASSMSSYFLNGLQLKSKPGDNLLNRLDAIVTRLENSCEDTSIG